MLKEISEHIKNLSLIKQILYGFADWVIIRDLNNLCINVYLNNHCINKYSINKSIIGTYIHDVCIKKVADYYSSCRERVLDSGKVFISKKIYTRLGKKYDGLLYFSPYKDKQNNIVGSASYNIEVTFLKEKVTKLFKNNLVKNNKNYELNYFYDNLIIYKDLLDEIIKIVDRLDAKDIIHNNNIVLIEHLKNNLNILLNNLKQVYNSLKVSL